MKQDNPPPAAPASRRVVSTGRRRALQFFCAAVFPLLPLAAATAAPAADFGPAAEAARPEVPEKGEAALGNAGAAVRLAPVVVVASRTPELLAEVSPSVSRIDVRQLADAGNYTLADALRTEQGVFTLGDATGNVQSIFIRGLEGRMTLVTLDGRRLNPGFSNFDATALGVEGLGAVEIMRGATSTIHGSDAAAGVIGLRSINPLEAVPEGKSSAGSVFAEAGSHGFTRGGLEVATVGTVGKARDLGRLGVSVGGSWTEGDGWRENSDHRGLTLLPRLDWQLNERVRLNLLTRYNGREGGMPGDTGAPSASDRFESSNVLVSPGVFFDVNEGLKFSAYYSYTRNEYRAFDPWGGDHNVADGHEATVQADWRPGDFVRLGGGFTFEYKQYERLGQNFDRGYLSNSPWVQAQITPVKDLGIRVAARYNQFSEYKDAFTGEVGLSYQLRATGTSFHARAANAYNVPDMGTVSYDLSYGYGAAAHFRTEDLKPEQNLAWEVGVRQGIRVLDGGSVSATFFQNNVTDMISWDWANRVGYNVDKARTQGVEIAADLHLNGQVRLFGNATFLDAKDLSKGGRLARRPDFSGTLGIEIAPAERARLGFSVTYVHGLEDNLYDYETYTSRRVDLKSYFYGRLYATVRLHGGLEVFGRVENAFDKSYSVAAGYPAPPITASAGLRYRW
jgi:vitamin B12 transporter